MEENTIEYSQRKETTEQKLKIQQGTEIELKNK